MDGGTVGGSQILLYRDNAEGYLPSCPLDYWLDGWRKRVCIVARASYPPYYHEWTDSWLIFLYQTIHFGCFVSNVSRAMRLKD